MFSSAMGVGPRALRRLALIALTILALVLGLAAQTATKTRKHKAKTAEKAQPELPPPPAPPPPPPTPEQMPARPPSVNYQNGQLSIIAPNSTLSDILQAVKSKTGASIDIPPGANERVISRFGPGPARDVLAALLNGSHFNYVMIGSDANPSSVAQVILTPRTGPETAPGNQPGGQMPNPGFPQYSGQVMRPQPYPGGQAVYQPTPTPPPADESPAPDSEEDDSAAQPDNANGTDEGAPEQVNQGNEGQENPPPQVKTPEQLLRELQRQQQLQQQQQQGQPPQPPSQQ